ncbi:helix-turn-helix domain-containing protein [Paenibacillus sambharensis]|uniref:helix-turn-helix domain-containing protein n=1 Tax=Paenibacillus sambharensis TaxID=1803190 RepID=UPI0015E87E90|nr:helix-turn-helix transcriptional regulator [Paenibacillus sambharensis]
MSTLGNKLKQLRREKRWTLAEVAEKLGLRGHSTYSNWEYDRTQPDAEMIAKLSKVYSVSTDFLLGRTEDPNHNLSEDAKTIIDILNLTDEEISEQIDLVVDGEKLTQEELLRFIAYVRTERQLRGLK